MKVLILNAGSSSLKYQLIDMDGEKLLAKGLIERIAIEGSRISQKVDGKTFEATAPMAPTPKASSGCSRR
jgi:acetate kinase